MNYLKYSAYEPIRNVHRVRRLLVDGRSKYHFYHRKTRDKLPGQPGSPEFMESYFASERVWAARCEQRAVCGAAEIQQPAQNFQTNVEA